MPAKRVNAAPKTAVPGKLIGVAPFAIPGRGPIIVLVTVTAVLEKIHLLRRSCSFAARRAAAAWPAPSLQVA
jgi:hypothetical protein